MDHQQIASYNLTHILTDIQRFLDQHHDGMIAIWGQTATGKTALSLELAKHFDVEVISADSRQIYRYMDIGTDKIASEIRAQIPHHQIDIIDPDEIYTAGDRQTATHDLIPQIQARQHLPLIVGGTGLYIDMVYRNFGLPDVPPDYEYRAGLERMESDIPGYCHALLTQVDPQEAIRHHPSSLRFIIRALEMYHVTGKIKSVITSTRPPIRPLMMLGLRRDVASGNDLIDARIYQMMEGGFIDEVKHLISLGYTDCMTSKKPILYPIVMGYLAGDYDRDECVARMKLGDRRLAKKQRTWFRRYLRDSLSNPVHGVVYQNYWVE